MLPGVGLVKTIIALLEYLIPQSFLGMQTQPILYFIIFMAFVYVVYRFLKFTFKAVLIFVAAGLFPVVANYFLGLTIPVTFNSILSYASVALFLFIVGMLLKSAVGILKAVTWPIRKLLGKSEEEEVEEKVEEYEEEH